MMSPTASSVTCGIGVALPVGLGEAEGEGARGNGDEVAVDAKKVVDKGCVVPFALGTIWVKGSTLAHAAIPRLIINKNTPIHLFFMIILNFQLHLPDGFQQRPALFEA
jgi:hypothetical protein